MTSIPLSQYKVALVDDEDADLAAVKWSAKKGCKTFYALRKVRKEDGRPTSQYLHLVIAARMGIKSEVDHKDRDGLNCTRRNLRPASRSQNGGNQDLRSNNVSGVKGVSWHKRVGKWQGRVMTHGKNRFLGYFDDIAEAEAAVQAAREKAFGEFACHG